MKEFVVEIYAVDWCGISECYTVMAQCEDTAGDVALEEYEQDFCDRFDLQPTGFCEYIESCDIDEEGNYDQDDVSTLDTRTVD